MHLKVASISQSQLKQLKGDEEKETGQLSAKARAVLAGDRNHSLLLT